MTWRNILRRRQWDAERALELEAYIEEETAAGIARGLSPADAQALAHRKLGNIHKIREEIYTMNTIGWLESVWQDFRYAVRSFRLNPGFFLIATASLVLGIGANTAIFQLLDAVRMRMLPVAHADELAEVSIFDDGHCCNGNFSNRSANFTNSIWEQISNQQRAFSGIFAWGDYRFNLAERGERHLVEGLYVSGDFFRTLGVLPAAGRLLTAADDQKGCGSFGAVIGHAFWQREFAGDPRITEKQISLDGHRVPIIGVAPRSFFGVEVGRNFDVMVPICAEPMLAGEDSHLAKRHHWWLSIMGRLKPGWTVAQATAQLKTASPAVFESTVPPNYRADDAAFYTKYKLVAKAAGGGVSGLRGTYQDPLYLLLAITGLVLLIACANLANLMLARATAREREVAVRLALGAGKGRLVRQLLAESALLTLAGVTGGILTAQWLSRFLISFLATGQDPLYLDLSPDWRLIGFTAGAGVLTCLLFGLYPALRAVGTPPSSAMKAGGRGMTATKEKFGLRRVLVAGQVALSLVLIAGALLFVRSLNNLMTIDSGLRTEGVLIVGVDGRKLNLAKDRRPPLFRQVLEQLRTTPGVENAASASIVEGLGNSWNDVIEIPGQTPKDKMIPFFNRVSPGYFATVGIPLRTGRDFADSDTKSSSTVAIVNEQFSRKYLGGANPVGREFRMLPSPGEAVKSFRIVGMVANSKYRGLRRDFEAVAYVAESQNKDPNAGIRFVVRSGLSAGPLMSGLKKTIANVNPEFGVEFQAYKTQMMQTLLRDRLMATLSGFFGVLAVILATIGLYGVISYMVARRKNEIGIRIALGANQGRVLRLVLREAGLLAGAGLLVGTGLYIAAARAARALLFQLQPADPVTIGIAVGLLGTVALIASFIPAFRASRLNPVTALREE